MKKTFGQRLKELRLEHNMSQESLAEVMHCERTKISRLELDKRNPLPMDAIFLSDYFGIPAQELLQYTDVNAIVKSTVTENDKLLPKLFIANEHQAKTIEYKGLDEVYYGYLAYDEARQDHVTLCDDIQLITDWMSDNQFIVLADPDTGEIRGIRNFGKHIVIAGELFSLFGFVPVNTKYSKDKTQFVEQIEKAKQLYREEINKAKKAAILRRPLLIVEHIYKNTYMAIDLTALEKNKSPEDARMLVYDYKAYKDTFRVSPGNATDSRQVVDGHGYYVYTPSQKFIDATGIELHPFVWERQMLWDDWEEREPWTPAYTVSSLQNETTSQRVIDTYVEAIEFVNLGRKEQIPDLHEVFVKLETSLSRMETFFQLLAPNSLMEKEADFLHKYMNIIKETLSCNYATKHNKQLII